MTRHGLHVFHSEDDGFGLTLADYAEKPNREELELAVARIRGAL